MDLGQAIKTLRVKQGLTQTQLAELCDMSTNSICSLETGKAYPPIATVRRLCDAFGVPQSYLLMTSIEEGDIPEEKRVLYKFLETLRNELIESKEP